MDEVAKVRVYELAKELGVESKVVIAKLQDFGVFVRSASSWLEATDVRRVRESLAPSDEVAKVRVYELAKELRVESKVVIAKLQDLGVFVRSASSRLEATDVRRVKESLAPSTVREPTQTARPSAGSGQAAVLTGGAASVAKPTRSQVTSAPGPVRAVNPARSRIVLIGTPAYADPGLNDVPQVANNLIDLAEVFTDPNRGGFDATHCVIAPAQAGAPEIGDLLIEAAAQAQDLLLVYYSGHGLLGPRRRELYLSLAGTRPRQLAFTALPFDAVRDACLDSPARSRVVILDCCFSGRAIGDALADDEVLGQVQVAGTYTLTAAPANRTAVVLPGERHTAFTERLLQLLHVGTPSAGPLLTLGDIYRHLLTRLRSEGLPEPQQRGTQTADLLGLARNPRHSQLGHSTVTTPTAPGVMASVVLPEQLLAGLESRYPRLRAAAVQELAGWLTDPDPDRVLAARTALEDAAENEVPLVAHAARTALECLPAFLPARPETARSDVDG
jgi:hypothetical protein